MNIPDPKLDDKGQPIIVPVDDPKSTFAPEAGKEDSPESLKAKIADLESQVHNYKQNAEKSVDEKDYKNLQAHATGKEKQVIDLKRKLSQAYNPDNDGDEDVIDYNIMQTEEINVNDPESMVVHLKGARTLVQDSIKENKKLGYRTKDLEAQVIGLTAQIASEERNVHLKSMGIFFEDDKNANLPNTVVKAITDIIAEKAKKGEKISMETGREIWEIRNKEAAEELHKLELEGGSTARGAAGSGAIPAKPVAPGAEEAKEENTYASALGGGLNAVERDLPPELKEIMESE